MNFYARTLRRIFSNGMEAYFLPRPGGSVEVECYVRTGSIHEAEFTGYGVSHFLEHMLFQGCEGFPEQRAAEEIRALGGSINACTGHEYTMVNAQGPARSLERMVEIVSAMVRSPELPEPKFELEKRVILRECDRTMDNASRRLTEELLRTVFPVHPLRHPICGYPELVSECRRDMLGEYHRRRYTPERCFWVLTGGFDVSAATELLERYCGEWKRGALFEPSLPADPPPRSPRSGEVVFPDPLARIALAVRLPGEGPLCDAAEVLFGTLGLGASSHLVRKLELEERLAVGVSASLLSLCGFTLGAVSASAAPAKFGRLEKRLFEELEAVRRNGIPSSAVEREKRQKYAELLRQTGDLRMLATNIGGAVLGGESPAECDRRIDRFSALTPEDVRRAAEKLLERGGFAVVRQLSAKSRPKRNTAAGTPERLRLLAPGLLLAPDASIPLVRMSLILPGGTIFEPAEAAGASALCANWLTAGTRRLAETEFWEKLESCGAELSVSSGLNSLGVSLSAPRRFFSRALKLTGELLASPRFGASEFERERERMIENCRCLEQSPGRAAMRRASAGLFGGHPYGRSRYGDEATLSALTPELVDRFYRSMLFPGRVFAAFGGDCSPEEAEAWRNALLRDVPWCASAPTLPPEPCFPRVSGRIDFELPREQTAVALALPGVRLGGNIDRRIDILQNCENGLASRVFRRVREDNALAYSVGMTMNGGFHRGSFLFYALTDETGAEPALELLKTEVRELAESGAGEADFLPAREAAAFEADSSLEQGSSVTDTAALELYYGAEPQVLLERGTKIHETNLPEFNALLKELFTGALEQSVSVVARGRGISPAE